MRTKRKKVKKVKSKKVFYKCKKTLTMNGTGEMLFKKGEKYQLVRKTKTSAKDLIGLILINENGFESIVYAKGWGKYFKLKKKK